MTTATATWLDQERLHLHHGPIDLVLTASADCAATARRAYHQATRRFASILEELVAELPALRRHHASRGPGPRGSVASRMHAAVGMYAPHVFITPMAAVAGAVADEVLAAMQSAGPLIKAYVNNGGDIAVHLGSGESFAVGVQTLANTPLGRIRISDDQGIGGLATSGQGGRSMSLGIADSVTVLAPHAAAADAAATLIANATDLPGHPGIVRMPACMIDEMSDLGTRRVVVSCAPLAPPDIREALENGARLARRFCRAGTIKAVVLCLQGTVVQVGHAALQLDPAP
ncbi:MAG: UPF0280 family protein [Rhodobacteraceae bacterium]|nr:UPF0280 family protein [Paracoccaceae bacterium]